MVLFMSLFITFIQIDCAKFDGEKVNERHIALLIEICKLTMNTDNAFIISGNCNETIYEVNLKNYYLFLCCKSILSRRVKVSIQLRNL